MSDVQLPPERPEPWTEDRPGGPAGEPEPSPQRRSVLEPPTVRAPITPPAAPAPVAPVGPAPEEPGPARRPMRLRTVVFGLVLLSVAALSLIGALTEVRLSPSLVAVAILVGAGFVLVAGGLSAALRESAGRASH